MENYLKQLEQGNMGEETALVQLGLEGIQEVGFKPHKSQPTMEALTAEYSRAKRVALAAQILDVGLLENIAMELMMFLEFLASFLYKCKIRVDVDASQVARALQIRIHHIKMWYRSIGEVLDEGQQQHHSEWLCDAIEDAVKGDQEALYFFGLDQSLSIKTGVMKEVPNVTKLKMHFRRAKECAAVGDQLGDKQLLAVGISVMGYTQYLADVKHQMKLHVPIDGQDVAGGLLQHIQSLNMLRERIERVSKGQLSSEEERCSDSDGGSKSSDENSDPDYRPAKIKRSKTEDQRIIPSQKSALSDCIHLAELLY